MDWIAAVCIGIALLGTLVAGVVLIVVCYKRRKYMEGVQSGLITPPKENGLGLQRWQHGSIGYVNYAMELTPEKLQINMKKDLPNITLHKDRLALDRVLYRGKHVAHCNADMLMMDGRYLKVSVKIFEALQSQEDADILVKDLVKISKLSHTNVMSILGISQDGAPNTPSGIEVLVTLPRLSAYVTLNNLLTLTRENNPELFVPRYQVNFALQIAHGARFLDQKGILHRNLRTETCMLNTKLLVKLTGFETCPQNAEILDKRWMAPETLDGTIFTIKGVVWAYGVVLWEMSNLGRTPYDDLNEEEVAGYLEQGNRLSPSYLCHKEFNNIMQVCWQAAAEHRPTFDEVIHRLQLYLATQPAASPPENVFHKEDDYIEDFYL